MPGQNIFRSLGLTPELADIAEAESRTPVGESSGGGGGSLESEFARLTGAGAISTTGMTVLDVASTTTFTLADGEEDGQEVHIINGAGLGDNNGCRITCNYFLAHSSGYNNVGRQVRIFEPHGWVRLKWCEEVTTALGTRSLWVVVGSSPFGAANPVARITFTDGSPPS